ncbi:PIN-like domain-containing protein [Brevibacterium sp. LE-L]|uniref:PIN-like domain-containing protein n=1 Tax=Brevibacterium sp. LE-L TaxID=3418557 RepID=UPI003CE7D3D7
MNQSGIYTEFQSYRIPSQSDIDHALRTGVIALDANVLLDLYRYNDQTVDDILQILQSIGERLFVPHQAVLEFWRNRQSVISSLGDATREAIRITKKNRESTITALNNWAKQIKLPDDQINQIKDDVQAFFEQLINRVDGKQTKNYSITQPSEDGILNNLERLLEGSVGSSLPPQEWESAVQEGRRRVEHQIPPGYCDENKTDSDLPEGPSGDYLVWAQLLREGADKKTDLVFITADVKEDWWNKTTRGQSVSARRELKDEYNQATGCQLILLEPVDLVRHSPVLGVESNEETELDIERVTESAQRNPHQRRNECIRALANTIESFNDSLQLSGSNNRGANALSITDPTGLHHRVYLTSSRNYATDSQTFISWHTIAEADLLSGIYESFILCPENESGDILFFIFTPDELREIASQKTLHDAHYHFYITRGEDSRFVDERPEAGSQSIDIQKFHNAWNSLY